MSDYKHTLNLPETEFPMRGDLAKREPNMLKRWYDQDLYGAIRRAKAGKLLHSARWPPMRTAAFTSVIRSTRSSKTSSSSPKASRFSIPLCAGLGLPRSAHRAESGRYGRQAGREGFRRRVPRRVPQIRQTQIEAQKTDFIRLGVLGDWGTPLPDHGFWDRSQHHPFHGQDR